MAKGRYGDFGGQYIPETLMNEIHKLEDAYEFYKNDKQFNDELNTLLDASTQIKNGIAQLDEGAAQLEQQVSFEAYKAILKENGLDLDVVKDGNAKAIAQLEQLSKLMPQLKDVILLLQGSTANIDAMQTYLDTVNGGIAQLHEGSSTLNSSYGEFDAGVQQLSGVLTGMLGILAGRRPERLHRWRGPAESGRGAAGRGCSPADRRHRRAAGQRLRHRHGR